jgi:hypothetical protein
MDEAEWLTCNDPQSMLEFLGGKANERKLRLFVCTCCRRIWQKFTDQQGRRAVEIAERLADGQAEPGEVATARTETQELLRTKEQQNAAEGQLSEAAYLHGYIDQWPLILAQSAIGKDVTTKWVGVSYDFRAGGPADLKPVVAFLRDLFGLLPFRPVSLDPAWRTPAMAALATAAYDERLLPAGTLDPDRLAVLADALEEAGCDNADILSHLRGPGPHVRGCWVLDALLGKE